MRIVIAEDAALIRAGLSEILTSAGHEVTGEVCDATELENVLRELAETSSLPDLVVSDVRMPPRNADDGLEAAVRLREKHPDLPIVLLSAYIGGPYLRRLVQNEASQGGIGYLLKERVSHVREFLQSLDVVASGGFVIDPEVLHAAMHNERDEYPGGHLTEKERQVIEFMSRGLSNTQISDQLSISAQGTSKHIASIFQKMGLHADEDNRRVRAILRWLRT
ncbi:MULTISPECIES: response regulator transcription factor [unclassified Brevibacterium]|uniref:response regulator transcription factor n=1 Tax=unclassified Brevibacterium TaxID=2614124 RepID=UPI0010926F6E|nr:response regulator transcription factor [Brevibacterium sp. S22]TGD26471.1 DNA-binding response regulator [Brevibacterium sp. S22]